MSSEISYNQFRNALQTYITESQQTIEELKSIRSFVKKCHIENNVIKTAGATTGVAATVAVGGLLFAPLTGGLSALATAVAIGASIGSAGFAVESLVFDRLDGKRAKKRIKYCQAAHERSINQLSHETNKILSVINQLVERGIDFHVATISTLAFLRDLSKTGTAFFDSLKAVASIENAIAIGRIHQILAPTGIKITKGLQGSLSVTFPSIQAMEKMTEAQLKAYAAIAQRPEILLGTTLSTLGKVVFVAQVFFSVVDVALLIRSWATKHPLIHPIDNFINQLEASIESTQNQLRSLEIFRQ